MECIIHCGLHKTGTSSIQHSALMQADKLLAHGVLYAVPNPRGERTQHADLARALIQGDVGYVKETLDLLIAEAERKQVGRILLSSEELLSAIVRQGPLFVTDVTLRFKAVRLVLVTRKLDKWLPSIIKQHMKIGEFCFAEWATKFYANFCSLPLNGAIKLETLAAGHGWITTQTLQYETLMGGGSSGLVSRFFAEVLGVPWEGDEMWVNKAPPLPETLLAGFAARAPGASLQSAEQLVQSVIDEQRGAAVEAVIETAIADFATNVVRTLDREKFGRWADNFL